jgi:hypothetical protein
MDDNHDNIIDYNNVVNYIEHCEISKNSEEQANNNQLFWSIIDQYQVHTTALDIPLKLTAVPSSFIMYRAGKS